MEQLSLLRISGRRTGEDQSVAQGGDEASGRSVAKISGIDSRPPRPFAQIANGGPSAASGKLADSAFGWRSGLPLRLGANKIPPALAAEVRSGKLRIEP